LIKDLPTHARAVTLRGEGLPRRRSGHCRETASSSTLSRPRQKRELDSALNELAARLNVYNEAVEGLSNQLAAAKHDLMQAETDVREARVRLGEAQETEQQAGLESESARRGLEWQKNQLGQLEAEAREAASIQQKLIETQVEVENKSSEAQTQLKALAANLAEVSLDELQEQASYWSTRVAVAEQGVSTVLARRDDRSREITRLDARRVELFSRLHEIDATLSTLDADKNSLREREGMLHGEIEKLRVKIDPSERDLETAEQQETRFAGDRVQRAARICECGTFAGAGAA